MRKHFVLLLALVLCIGLVSGCSAKETTAAYVHQDLTLHLPPAYLDLSDQDYADQYDFFYGLDSVIISGLRDEKSLFDGFNVDLQVYADLVLTVNELDCELTQADGIRYFTYEAGSYTYVVTLWETGDAFWTVQAYCPTEDYSRVSDQMWEILRSVTV